MTASPSTAHDYFDITMTGAASANSFTSSTSVTNFNFTGVYQNVRFSWGNDQTGNTGVLTKSYIDSKI